MSMFEALDLALYQLRQHEGYRRHPYTDTVGKLTIGYGRNLEDTGISEAEAEYLLEQDVARADRELRTAFRFYDRLTARRQAALVNMHVNMGLPRLMTFVRMIAALEHEQWKLAAAEALDSQWALQVGNRAKEIATLLDEEEE